MTSAGPQVLASCSSAQGRPDVEPRPAALPAGTVLLEVAYDGAAFHGWQTQGTLRTVAATFAAAVQAMDGAPPTLRGCSRTDAGVHALGQLVAFDPQRPSISLEGWLRGLNTTLPRDVRVRRVWQAPLGFTPRFEAASKRYIYTIGTGHLVAPWLRGQVWHIGATTKRELNLERMREGAALLLGTHDYAAFKASDDPRDNTVRTLFRCDLEVHASRTGCCITVTVEGTAFMKQMVRIIVGTLADIGLGLRSPSCIRDALESRQRASAGTTAPPQGLCLDRITLRQPEALGPCFG